jgi:hypothetical protein
MGIRASNNTKDHLRHPGSVPALALVVSPSPPTSTEDSLRFETSHIDKPCFVDLTVFKEGEFQPSKKGGNWAGPFKGRPELIAELLPAIRDQWAPLAEKSVEQYLASLRAWWRLFDALEATASAPAILTSTTQLSDLHRQCALDKGMRRMVFGNFLRLANTTRTALGLRPLHWQSPEDKAGNSHLPPTWQTDHVRRALKHRWFAALDRWALADELRQQGASLAPQMPSSDPERARLLRNYVHFDVVVASSRHPRPAKEALWESVSKKVFYRKGYSVGDMLRGRYPDGDDIRAAFHLCLATTGWNAAVLLSLDVDEPFIESHPKDPGRYIMRGTKWRAGGTEQVSEGLFKTQGSAGVVLRTLIARTAPLREQLRRELQACNVRFVELKSDASGRSAELDQVRRRITALEQGARSPWLFASQASVDIQWLTDNDFAKSVEKLTASYIGDLIVNLNRHQPEDRQLTRLTASDLRDAYAVNAYHASSGSILSVMKALGHRQPRSTQVYLNNTLLREEHRKLFGTFSAGLWQEMATNGRVDPTILAKLSRDGVATTEQRERLRNYRTIMLSRIGVGCKDPLNPPRHIAPDFVPDGKVMCHVQRCTLCVEHAVILPESLPGLCKRLAELRDLRSRMGVGAFQESSFLEEMDNTELALQAFDAAEVERNITDWSGRIASGTHRVIEFDGREREVAR